MLQKIQERPKTELPEKFEKLKEEDLRVVQIGTMVRNIWTQIKQKTEVTDVKQELSKEFNLSVTSIERLVSGNSSLPLKFVHRILMIWQETVKPDEENVSRIIKFVEENAFFKGDSNSVPVKLPKYLTPQLSYLIGALRDGSLPKVYNNEYEVQFSQLNIEWLEAVVAPLIENVFGIRAEVESYNGQTPRIKIYSKPIYVFIKIFFEHPERLQVTWEVPSLIRNSPLEIKKWFIRGFFDSEGEINVRQKRITIHHSWNGKTPIVLEQLKEILERDFNVRAKVSKPHKEKNFPSFDLRISKENVLLFYKKIGTSHPEKFKKFQTFWNPS